MKPGETLVLVDGSSLAFRSFYALFTSGLRRSDGTPTWAVYGFFNSLFDLLERHQPDGIAVCFDMSAPTFRHEEFEEYKANRKEMPDDLSVQWPIIKEAVQVLGIPVYELSGYEADDVIGTVAHDAIQKGIKVIILTGDQDSFQLIDHEGEMLRILMPQKVGLSFFGRAEVHEKLGIWPEQVIDYKALCGDVSDNIPGIKGIGAKTAVTLLTSYNTLDGIYENVESVKQPALKKKLVEGKEAAYASQRLATIVKDAPLQFDFDHCALSSPPLSVVQEYFSHLEFARLVARLPKLLTRFAQQEGGGAAGDLPAKPSFIQATTETVESNREAAGDVAVAVETVVTTVILAEPPRALIESPTPDVVTTAAELKTVVAKIIGNGSFALEMDVDSELSLRASITGFALAWGEGFTYDHERNVLQTTQRSDQNAETMDYPIHTAYVSVRNAFGESLNLEDALLELKPLLENKAVAKVIHYSKSKMNALSLVGSDLKAVAFDPMLASYIVNPDDKHSLKDIAERTLGYSTIRAKEPPATGKKQLTINFASMDKVSTTSADDARVSLELARYYLERLDHDQRELMFDMDLPFSSVLSRMEQIGVALDTSYLSIFSGELNQDLTRLENEIYEIVGHSFNINSPLQLQKVLFEELSLKPKGKTKTGFSTDASVLEALKTEHVVVEKIVDYRQLSKLRSTYVDALPKEISQRDLRVHGEFNQTSTSTGRLSSTNPNLQNIPIRTEAGRRIRRAFVPQQKSHKLMSADYSQIELRLLAHMCGDEKLIEAFEKDQDIHASTAAGIFDIPIESVTSDHRRVGKTLNFALVYQQGAFATAQALGISTKEAQAFIDRYFARYPKVRGFLARTINDARMKGYVSTLWGRKRHFRNLNDKNDVVRKADERAACNAPIQGSAADLMKLAMIRLDNELREREMKAKIILQVHDELVLEVPEDELQLAEEVVRHCMQLDQLLSVPLKVDVGVGDNWMDAK